MLRNEQVLILKTDYLEKNAGIMSDIVNKHSDINLIDIFTPDPDFYNPIYKNCKKKLISINCADTPGIIHESTKIISDMNIEIETLQSDTETAPISGCTIFNMSMVINIPKDVSTKEIKLNLYTLRDFYGFDIDYQDIE
tara:strand:+ start:574 stop:990 length:417 start_codon:yes stop_codon:yes gene_type:complete